MRKYERHAYRSVAILRIKSNNSVCSTEYVCTILDVSEGGIKFSADFRFSVGTQFVLLQPKCKDGGLLEVQGEIVWANEIEYRTYQYGARLFDSDGAESLDYRKEVRKIKYYNIFSSNTMI